MLLPFNKRKTMILWTGCLAVSVFLLSGCGEERKLPSLPIPPAKVEVLSENDKPVYEIKAVGTVKPMQEVEIVSLMAGTIDLDVNLGSKVNAGELLATIDKNATDNSADIGLKSVKTQLQNAESTADETLANSDASVKQAEIQVETLQKSLDQLKRNFKEMQELNEKTQETMESQVETAKINSENASVAKETTEDQLNQSYDNFYKNAENSVNRFMTASRNLYESITDIINTNRKPTLFVSDIPAYLSISNQQQKNIVANLYNQIGKSLDEFQAEYEDTLPLNEENAENIVEEAGRLSEEVQSLAEAMRILLSSAHAGASFPESTLSAYKNVISAGESGAASTRDAMDTLLNAYRNLEISKNSQGTLSGNNAVIAEKQWNDAKNALSQFEIKRTAGEKDMENQIGQMERQLETAKTGLETAKRGYEIAKSGKAMEISLLKNQVALAQKSVNENQITSDIEGVISELNVDKGDHVNPGTVIGKVIQYEQIKIVFYVDETSAGYMKVNQAVNFEDMDKKEKKSAVISAIAPMADTVNKKIRVEAFTSNYDLNLKPETLVNLSVNVSNTTFDKNKIYVPLNSIMIDQNEKYVFIAGEDNTTKKRMVTTGKIFENWVEITSGLTKEDVVITEGQRNLEEGQAIEIISS